MLQRWLLDSSSATLGTLLSTAVSCQVLSYGMPAADREVAKDPVVTHWCSTSDIAGLGIVAFEAPDRALFAKLGDFLDSADPRSEHHAGTTARRAHSPHGTCPRPPRSRSAGAIKRFKRALAVDTHRRGCGIGERRGEQSRARWRTHCEGNCRRGDPGGSTQGTHYRATVTARNGRCWAHRGRDRANFMRRLVVERWLAAGRAESRTLGAAAACYWRRPCFFISGSTSSPNSLSSLA